MIFPFLQPTTYFRHRFGHPPMLSGNATRTRFVCDCSSVPTLTALLPSPLRFHAFIMFFFTEISAILPIVKRERHASFWMEGTDLSAIVLLFPPSLVWLVTSPRLLEFQPQGILKLIIIYLFYHSPRSLIANIIIVIAQQIPMKFSYFFSSFFLIVNYGYIYILYVLELSPFTFWGGCCRPFF